MPTELKIRAVEEVNVLLYISESIPSSVKSEKGEANKIATPLTQDIVETEPTTDPKRRGRGRPRKDANRLLNEHQDIMKRQTISLHRDRGPAQRSVDQLAHRSKRLRGADESGMAFMFVPKADESKKKRKMSPPSGSAKRDDPETDHTVSQKSIPGGPRKSENTDPTIVKRGRGRPRKDRNAPLPRNLPEKGNATALLNHDNPVDTRGRGRPRKYRNDGNALSLEPLLQINLKKRTVNNQVPGKRSSCDPITSKDNDLGIMKAGRGTLRVLRSHGEEDTTLCEYNENPTAKGGKARPPEDENVEIDTARYEAKEKFGPGCPHSSFSDDISALKSGRGRPRKDGITPVSRKRFAENKVAPAGSRSDNQTRKRGRGRPRKNGSSPII